MPQRTHPPIMPGAQRRHAVDVRAVALPDGVAMYTEAAFGIAIRRPTGEVVVRRGLLPPLASAGSPRGWKRILNAAPRRVTRRMARALWVWSMALRFAVGQGGTIATADVGAQALATQASARYAEQRAKQSLWAFAMGVSLAPLLFALMPWVVLRMANLSQTSWLGDVALGLVEATVVFLFVPLYVRFLRLWPSWRRLFGYHGASHQVRASFFAGLPLRVATARTMHPQQTGCGGSNALAIALVAAGASHLVEASMPASTPLWAFFWLRLAAIVPAAALVLSGRAAVRSSSRRKLDDSGMTRLSRLWLPLADEPDDGMREVALCAMVTLFSDNEKHENALMPRLDWRLAGACVPFAARQIRQRTASPPKEAAHAK